MHLYFAVIRLTFHADCKVIGEKFVLIKMLQCDVSCVYSDIEQSENLKTTITNGWSVTTWNYIMFMNKSLLYKELEFVHIHYVLVIFKTYLH